MNVDVVLATIGIAVSVAGLVPIFLIGKEDRRKETIAAGALTFLLVLTVLMWVRSQYRARDVDKMKSQITDILSNNLWTMEQVYSGLFFPKPDVFFEAFADAVAKKQVCYRPDVLRTNDGSIVNVRLYYAGEACQAQNAKSK